MLEDLKWDHGLREQSWSRHWQLQLQPHTATTTTTTTTTCTTTRANNRHDDSSGRLRLRQQTRNHIPTPLQQLSLTTTNSNWRTCTQQQRRLIGQQLQQRRPKRFPQTYRLQLYNDICGNFPLQEGPTTNTTPANHMADWWVAERKQLQKRWSQDISLPKRWLDHFTVNILVSVYIYQE